MDARIDELKNAIKEQEEMIKFLRNKLYDLQKTVSKLEELVTKPTFGGEEVEE